MITDLHRYLLFAGGEGYPDGGWGDFISSYSELEDAKIAAEEWDNGWAEIVDIRQGMIIWKFEGSIESVREYE